MRSVRFDCHSYFTHILTAWDAHAASGDDAELARSARLETILRVALERNPDLAENQARARAAEARGEARLAAAGPRSQVRAVGRAARAPVRARTRPNTLMLGLRQTFPAWGTLDARGRAAGRGGRQRAGRRARAPAGGRGPGAARPTRPTTAPIRSCACTSSTSGSPRASWSWRASTSAPGTAACRTSCGWSSS